MILVVCVIYSSSWHALPASWFHMYSCKYKCNDAEHWALPFIGAEKTLILWIVFSFNSEIYIYHLKINLKDRATLYSIVLFISSLCITYTQLVCIYNLTAVSLDWFETWKYGDQSVTETNTVGLVYIYLCSVKGFHSVHVHHMFKKKVISNRKHLGLHGECTYISGTFPSTFRI